MAKIKAAKGFAPMLAKGPKKNTPELFAEHLAAIEAHIKHNGPVIGSYKLDGFRCLVRDGVAVTRKLVLLPNDFTRLALSHPTFNGLDGELVVNTNPGAPLATFSQNQSAFKRKKGTPDFALCVFDDWTRPNEAYEERLLDLWSRAYEVPALFIHKVDQKLLWSLEETLKYEKEALGLGYEGLILRDPRMPYKYDRSTVKEFGMIKLKRWADSEAEVLSYTEQMTNNNVSTQDALGHTKRGTSKENMAPAGTMGSFHVRDLTTGVEFDIGAGPTQADCDEQWAIRDQIAGQIVSYRFQPSGVKDKPRFPQIRGLRAKEDMS